MTVSLPSLEAIHREFHPKVLRYLGGMVGADEAPDLAQVTMMKVSEHLPEFRGDSSLSTWIYRIATNVARDRLRQLPPQTQPIEADEEGAGRDVPPQLQSPSAEATAIRAEMSACVREFVDRLPPNYRSVLVLSEVEGLTNAEIAEAAGLSLETVKIRLHRARAKLAAALLAGCRIERDGSDEIACDRKPITFVK